MKSFLQKLSIATFLLSTLSCAHEATAELKVKITREISSVKIKHNGKLVEIKRNQNTDNTIHSDYARTSRDCPPFCIKPIKLLPGVETIGELEMLQYLQKVSKGDQSLMVIDSRTPSWVKKGTIPGSINLPWTLLNTQRGGADPISIAEIITEKFGVTENDDLWDFTDAKTLVLFCNGMWCGQSPNNIKSLINLGYPAHKLKWYRGGMQNWHTLGLTTVK